MSAFSMLRAALVVGAVWLAGHAAAAEVNGSGSCGWVWKDGYGAVGKGGDSFTCVTTVPAGGPVGAGQTAFKPNFDFNTPGLPTIDAGYYFVRADYGAMVASAVVGGNGDGLLHSAAEGHVFFTDTVTLASATLPIGTLVRFQLEGSGGQQPPSYRVETGPGAVASATLSVRWMLAGDGLDVDLRRCWGIADPSCTLGTDSFTRIFEGHVGDTFTFSGFMDATASLNSEAADVLQDDIVFAGGGSYARLTGLTAGLDFAAASGFDYTVWSAEVPEPGTALLIGAGILAGAARRRHMNGRST